MRPFALNSCGRTNRDDASLQVGVLESGETEPLEIPYAFDKPMLRTNGGMRRAAKKLPVGTEPVTQRDENKNVMSQGFFNDNHEIGTWMYYHERTNTMSMTGDYLYGGVRDGVWQYFHSNGEPQAIGRFTGNQEEGIWTWYHFNGTPSLQGYMLDGMRHGSVDALVPEWANRNEGLL